MGRYLRLITPLLAIPLLLVFPVLFTPSRTVQAGGLLAPSLQEPLLQNHSFEAQLGNPSSWTFIGPCNFNVSAGVAYHGNNYLVTNRNNTSACSSFYQDVNLTPVAGETYRFAIWARASTQVTRQSEVVIWALGGPPVKGNTFFSVSGTQWRCAETSLTLTTTGHIALRAEVYYHSTDDIDYHFDYATFQVGGPPICPPSFAVIQTAPLSNSKTVPLDQLISATFDAAPDPGAVTSRTFTVRGRNAGPYTGSHTLPETNTIRFEATDPFKPGELVEVSLSSGLQSVAGNPLKPYTWQFRTAVVGGGGAFTRTQQELAAARTGGVGLGDLDGDRDLDIFAVSATLSDPNRIWFNDGGGTFVESAQVLTSLDGDGVGLGDLDGDGDLDAFLITDSRRPDQVWFNDGTGRFSDSGQRLGAFNGAAIALGDVDGDGDLDAFIGELAENWNQLWLNDGNGYFTDSSQRISNGWSAGVALGDLDGDGDLDAFMANWSLIADEVWFNDGYGHFYDSGQRLAASDGQGVDLGDLDNDGDLDAFVANQNEQPDEVWLNDGRGFFTLSQKVGNADSEKGYLGDLDGDGDLDVYIVTEDDKPDEVWFNDGHGQFSDSDQRLGQSNGQTGALGDLNGDGALDIAVGNLSQANEVRLNQRFAALAIGKTAPLVAEVGDLITYTLWVTNTGNLTATNLVITDLIPAGAAYISGGTRIDKRVYWIAPDLGPGKILTREFVVTAAETIKNEFYEVSADGDVSASGQTLVITVINGCPPLPNYVCVVDDVDQPMPGALIYRNGVLVTDLQGMPRRTNSQGIITFTTLVPGDVLVAFQAVYTQPTHKMAHNPEDEGNFAFRVYRTSMPINNNGQPGYYVVPGSNLPHTLKINPNNTLVLFNIVASVEWDASDEYLAQLEEGLISASDLLYNATDGQMAWGWITIYDNGDQWRNADVHFQAHNHTWPHAYVGGVNTNDLGEIIYKGFDFEPGYMVLGRYWNGLGAQLGAWNKPEGYKTIAHEFGHYGLFLFDEYFYYEDAGNEWLAQPARCSINSGDPASLMFYQYTKVELCNRPDQYSALTRQTQVYGSLETSWVTLQGVYSNVLQALHQGVPPWQIVSPRDRGISFMPGPDKPPLKLPLTYILERSSGGLNGKTITVFDDKGGRVWGALVSLHRANGIVLDQGLTDHHGEIEILGAAPGDLIRVRTPLNNLGGSLPVQDGAPERLHLSPVFSGTSNLASQDAPTETTPLITIVPRSDGATIDYFMAKTGKLDKPVEARVVGADAPPGAAGTMSYDGVRERYAIAFSGYSNNSLQDLTLRISTTANISTVVEIGIGHKRSHTDDTTDELDLTSPDGNLTLNAPANSFNTPTYVVVNATNALPGLPPPGRVAIGESYSLQPSGAITGSQRPMALTLAYQSISVGAVDEKTIKPYYWVAAPAGGGQWSLVPSYTLNITANQVWVSTDLFGIYVLLGQLPGPDINKISPSSAEFTASTTFIIEGKNFKDQAQVRFNGPGAVLTLPADFVAEAGNILSVSVPTGSLLPGIYDVTVANPDSLEDTLPSALTITGVVPRKIYIPLIVKH